MRLSIAVIGFVVAGLLRPASLDAATLLPKPRKHGHSATTPDHGGTEAYRASMPGQFRTVQPPDDGTGALAPNGYRGAGSASGGPAGGISTGGP